MPKWSLAVTRNGMPGPNYDWLTVQPCRHAPQVEIVEPEAWVPHAYAEDQSLGLVEL